MDNVEKYDSYINIPLAQDNGFYVKSTYVQQKFTLLMCNGSQCC
jgi:hypothetical protein